MRISHMFRRAQATALVLPLVVAGGAGLSRAASASPTALFTSATGSGRACSAARPCTVDTALADARPGTKVLMSEGEYGVLRIAVGRRGAGALRGVQLQPRTPASQPGVHLRGLVVSAAGVGVSRLSIGYGGVQVTSPASDVALDHLIVTGTGTAPGRPLIDLQGSGTLLRSSTVVGYGGPDLVRVGGGDRPVTGVRLTDNHVTMLPSPHSGAVTTCVLVARGTHRIYLGGSTINGCPAGDVVLDARGGPIGGVTVVNNVLSTCQPTLRTCAAGGGLRLLRGRDPMSLTDIRIISNTVDGVVALPAIGLTCRIEGNILGDLWVGSDRLPQCVRHNLVMVRPAGLQADSSNRVGDPRWIDRTGLDYRLGAGSAASSIGGSVDMATDISARKRVLPVSAGAYEAEASPRAGRTATPSAPMRTADAPRTVSTAPSASTSPPDLTVASSAPTLTTTEPAGAPDGLPTKNAADPRAANPATTAPSPQPTQGPVATASLMPDVATTGVPLGLTVPATAYRFWGESVHDARPLEPLRTASAVGLRPDANGLAYAPNAAIALTYDHVDFTNVKLVVPAAVTSVTFSKCLFRTTDPSLSLDRARGANLVQILGANTAVTFQDCTLQGDTPDPHYACQLFLSVPGGNTSRGGITFLRNNISGFSTGLSIGDYAHFLYRGNYVHDLVIDKHFDSGDFTNSNVWTHVDGLQIGATHHVGTGEVSDNVLMAFSATTRIASAAIQIGQMTGPGSASIDTVSFQNNYLDGGAYVVGANLNTPVDVTGALTFLDNHVGLHFAYGVDGGGSVHSLATAWSGNTYQDSGMAGSDRPMQVVHGQPIS